MPGLKPGGIKKFIFREEKSRPFLWFYLKGRLVCGQGLQHCRF